MTAHGRIQPVNGWREPLRGEQERYRYGMAIRVECYAGYRGEQEPLAFWLGERQLAVRAIVDRWFAPTQRWFKVDAGDGNVYVLRHDEASGEWELVAYGAIAADGALAHRRDRPD